MALQLTPALEQRLADLAAQIDRTPDQLAQGATEAYVTEYEELLAAVKEADGEIARGECADHEEVVRRFERRFAKG